MASSASEACNKFGHSIIVLVWIGFSCFASLHLGENPSLWRRCHFQPSTISTSLPDITGIQLELLELELFSTYRQTDRRTDRPYNDVRQQTEMDLPIFCSDVKLIILVS